MFYKFPLDQVIRQGDVTEGLISFGAIAYKLLSGDDICDFDSQPCFGIDLRFNYNVVMTPCCTIEKANYISFCPLYPVSKKIKNLINKEYLNEDPTRINTPVPAEKCVSVRYWNEKLTEVEREMKRQQGKTYTELSYFVFRKHDGIFEEDMTIDFNDIFCIRKRDLGNYLEKMLPFKVLQLTNDTRANLRQKLVKFFGRDPEEDLQCKI